jgi:hypothetical protein
MAHADAGAGAENDGAAARGQGERGGVGAGERGHGAEARGQAWGRRLMWDLARWGGEELASRYMRGRPDWMPDLTRGGGE